MARAGPLARPDVGGVHNLRRRQTCHRSRSQTFLAGSLLTLLLPVALLIALVVWYWVVSRRVPETADRPDPAPTPAAANPRPNAPPRRSPPSAGA